MAVPPSGASEVLCHSAFNKSPSRVPNLQAKLSGLALPWVDCFSAMLPSATSLERDICQSEEYSGLGYQEWNCWNGTHLGRYVCGQYCLILHTYLVLVSCNQPTSHHFYDIIDRQEVGQLHKTNFVWNGDYV